MKQALLNSGTLYKEISNKIKEDEVSKKLKEFMSFAERYILFISLLAQMDPETSKISVTTLAPALASLTLKILIRKVSKELQNCIPSMHNDLLLFSSLIFNPAKKIIDKSQKIVK